MTLQAKLTVGSVLLATLMVSILSTVDLGDIMQLELQAAYDRADLVKSMARDTVIETLHRLDDQPLRVAVRDEELNLKLVKLLTESKVVFSIDLVSAETNDVIASTLENRLGTIPYPPTPDFAPLVKQANWFEEFKALFADQPHDYVLQEPLGSGNTAVLYLRVIIYPAFLRPALTASFMRHAKVAGLSIALAVFLTFLFSMVAFRKLGRIG
jgi:hypothetical protein